MAVAARKAGFKPALLIPVLKKYCLFPDVSRRRAQHPNVSNSSYFFQTMNVYVARFLLDDQMHAHNALRIRRTSPTYWEEKTSKLLRTVFKKIKKATARF